MSIFVIDDHPLMREAVAMLIRRLSSQANVVELDSLAAVQAAVTTHGAPRLLWQSDALVFLQIFPIFTAKTALQPTQSGCHDST